ncbi:TolB family protein [Dictyobacter kobayashii]|uniref:Lipoprotein LpqB beta-propeller domain-containing protein n=1 Tax=Dictyobacter kobayashii TaxID=2014872 RepID=A0A402AB60_9CHLR|nr:PD40 domain-containing protein [Dictyobacter kobayashii]GCE16349.1 hypothetical protein KDK_01490 [Dictyobacter kobayashii]
MLSLSTRHILKHNTRRSRKTCIALLVLMLCQLLAACTPGHSGDDVVAFIRDGQLWTLDPSGANAFSVVSQSTPVVGYAWSPNHRLLAFRTLDADFAKSAAAKSLSPHPQNELIGDLPSTLNTIGVDGGTPISIAFSSPDFSYNNPQWNSNGTRLIYRQTPKNFSANPSNAQWWISQNDQPGGIAAKPFSNTFSIPSISYDSNNYLITGNDTNGAFTTTIAGTQRAQVTGPLPGHPLPASLERILWRPAHQNQSFLYAVEDTKASQTSSQLSVKLVWHTLEGPATTVATCACTQFSWSPDGNYIVYSIGTQMTLLNVTDTTSFTVNSEANAVPYWSPDSKFLLLDSSQTLSLVNISTRQQVQLLRTHTEKSAAPITLPSTNSLLQPISNNLWSADSRHFIFLSRDHSNWQQHTLLDNKALYTIEINDAGKPQGTPTKISDGTITEAGWTYQDPSTSFLY